MVYGLPALPDALLREALLPLLGQGDLGPLASCCKSLHAAIGR